jgi:excinuclease UvrABC nuclease subunit
VGKKLKQLEETMYRHAKNLEFEQATKIRDEIKVLQGVMSGVDVVKCKLSAFSYCLVKLG